MGKTHNPGRRMFLKTTAAGTAGLAIGGVFTGKAEGAWVPGMRINPAIDNLRVVCCHDPAMVTQTPVSWDFASVNSRIAAARVSANLDAMAMSLANKTSAAEAWATIFLKPAAKTWAQVKVAFKVNCIEPRNMPRVAIIDRVARALNTLGVPYSGMVIYDGCSNAAGKYDTTAIRALLPAGIVVSNGNGSLGGFANAAVPGFSGTYPCTAQMVNGTVDILINCAVNKGHSNTVAGATLCCKNHFGTFDPGPIKSVDTTGAVFNINKSDAIIGGTPARQQLCIMDTLFASIPGPDAIPDSRLNRILMGTFAPAIDYLTIKRIREPLMNADHDDAVVARFATDFGYTSAQFAALNLVNVLPVGIEKPADGENPGIRAPGPVLNFVVLGSGFVTASASFALPRQPGPLDVRVLDVSGRLVCKVPAPHYAGKSLNMQWDGAAGGQRLPGGTYVVKVTAGRRSTTAQITLVKR